jgi:hypothetical protein
MNFAKWCTCGHDISAHRGGTGECNPCGASGVGEDAYPTCARFESIGSVMAQRALPTPDNGCSCGWYSEDRGGGHHETMQEYDPACPIHSVHVYNPRTGVWETAPDHVCPGCGDGRGWRIEPDPGTGEPMQVQCECGGRS